MCRSRRVTAGNRHSGRRVGRTNAARLNVVRLLTELELLQAGLIEWTSTEPLSDAEVLRARGVFDDDSAAITRPGDDRQYGFAF